MLSLSRSPELAEGAVEEPVLSRVLSSVEGGCVAVVEEPALSRVLSSVEGGGVAVVEEPALSSVEGSKDLS